MRERPRDGDAQRRAALHQEARSAAAPAGDQARGPDAQAMPLSSAARAAAAVGPAAAATLAARRAMSARPELPDAAGAAVAGRASGDQRDHRPHRSARPARVTATGKRCPLRVATPGTSLADYLRGAGPQRNNR